MDADVTTIAADVTMDVAVVITAAAFPWETIPAATSFGSSSCSACVAITDGDATMAVAAVTAAGSSSFFCSAAEIMDVAATTAVKKIRRKGRGYFLCPFCRCFFAASCFFFFSSRHFRSIS